MKRTLTTIVIIAVIAVLGLGLFMTAARSGWLRPSELSLRARYGLPNSRFVDIQGQAVHLVGQGEGPVIVLVHGSFASLRMWDDWVAALVRRYRVIRFDRPGMGLSGPSPDQRYDGDAEARLLRALADDLELERFFLVGTSSGGEAVAAFAARYPERISGVVLSNIAAGPLRVEPHDYPLWFDITRALDRYLGGWHMRALWRGVLQRNFANPARVTPDLVRQWTDLNNRAQGWPRKPRPGGRPPFAGTPDDLRAIAAPALVLWSAQDPETTLKDHGQRTLELLGSNDKTLRVVQDCGHMMPIECGRESIDAALPFFNRTAKGESK